LYLTNRTKALVTPPSGLSEDVVGPSGAAASGLGIGGTVPEPGTLALLAAGLIGLIGYTWRRRGQSQ
jgi:hypothetical protein